MKLKSQTAVSLRVSSNLAVLLVALISALAVLAAALCLQWLVYDDWLHETGLRVTGSLLASLLTFIFAYRWQSASRERKIELRRRFETIADMNDRVRNALQVIECATYATNPGATAPVRYAVDSIEQVLREVLVDAHPTPSPAAKADTQTAPGNRNPA
jgi:hypothetical protein